MKGSRVLKLDTKGLLLRGILSGTPAAHLQQYHWVTASARHRNVCDEVQTGDRLGESLCFVVSLLGCRVSVSSSLCKCLLDFVLGGV